MSPEKVPEIHGTFSIESSIREQCVMQIKTIVSAAAIGLVAVAASTAQAAPFDTIVVDADGMATADDCESDDAADFSVIQDAVDDASDTTKLNKRDVILVSPRHLL